MKKIFLLMVCVVFPVYVQAGFIGGQDPSAIFGSTKIRFGIQSPPDDTCNYFGRHFQFDATTEKGKNLLTILLAAKMGNKQIDVWYVPSSAQGTDQTSGCTHESMAVVSEIGIK